MIAQKNRADFLTVAGYWIGDHLHGGTKPLIMDSSRLFRSMYF
jgi:hypothetical protein